MTKFGPVKNSIKFKKKIFILPQKCHRVYLGDVIMILLLCITVIERGMLLSTFRVVMLRKIKYEN